MGQAEHQVYHFGWLLTPKPPRTFYLCAVGINYAHLVAKYVSVIFKMSVCYMDNHRDTNIFNVGQYFFLYSCL